MAPQTAVMKIQNNPRVRSRTAVSSKLNPGMGEEEAGNTADSKPLCCSGFNQLVTIFTTRNRQ